MLDAEGDADNGDKAEQGGQYMADGQPDARKYEPDHVPDGPQDPGADVAPLVQLLPADGHFAKRKEREPADHKAGLPPGNPHNGDKCKQAVQPPGQAHYDAPEYKPDQVSDCSHGFWLIRWLVWCGLVVFVKGSVGHGNIPDPVQVNRHLAACNVNIRTKGKNRKIIPGGGRVFF